MNILFVDNSPWWGGAEKCLNSYIKRNALNYFNVKICFPFPMQHQEQYLIDTDMVMYRNKKISPLMAEYYKNPIKGLDRLNKIVRAKQLKNIVYIEKPDIVYFNLFRNRDLWDIIEVKKQGCKVVLHVRNLYHQAKYKKEILDLADLIIGTSQIVCNEVKDTGTKTKIVCIYDGVNAHEPVKINQSNLRKEYGVNSNHIVALFPAIIDPRKGQDLAIEAFLQVADRLPNLVLMIIGGCDKIFNDYGNKIKEMASRNKDRIKLLGHQTDVGKFYSIADYTLALSHDGEAYGLVPIESALHKLPIIATKAGATPELIVDNETGIMVTPGSLDDVCTAMIRMHDSCIREKFGEEAFKRIAHNFSLESGLIKLNNELKKIL